MLQSGLLGPLFFTFSHSPYPLFPPMPCDLLPIYTVAQKTVPIFFHFGKTNLA
jgi:hypothetical protein